MHTLTGKRVAKFAREFGFDGTESEQFERYVAAHYLYPYLNDNVELIEDSIIGGGEDEGIDIAAVIVNGRVVNEPEEIDEAIADQGTNTAKVVFIQAKTGESYDSKMLAKFLHGVESVTKHAMQPAQAKLPPRLVDLAALVERIAENGDKFRESRIPCDLFYVTTSSTDGASVRSELQVSSAVDRIRELGVYWHDLQVRTHGHEELAAKQKERFGPQNIQFNFEKRQTLPATERVTEAYIGLLNARQLLRLLCDDSGDMRTGIFDDNVRLDLGPSNPVNVKILETLTSADREHFPFLNNGLTVIATELRGLGDKFFISGYQIVNGGQTSHQLLRWSASAEVAAEPALLDNLWIPVKIVSSKDAGVRTSVAVATNLQTAIGATDIQASLQKAKDVEEYFEQSGAEGLRYERQNRGSALAFPRTRVVTTPELNRAVAATVFGDSSRAIGSPKDLETQDSYVWGDPPVEAYYYAAWIIYRIDRFFARTPSFATLKAAKYHIAMMVSAIINKQLADLFSSGDSNALSKKLKKPKGLQLKVADNPLATGLEDAIQLAVDLTKENFGHILEEGRSLRKDDVRSRRNQESLLQMAKDATETK